MIPLFLPVEGPPWLQSFADSILQAIAAQALPRHESTALPDPTNPNQRFKTILVTDLNAGVGMTAFSNGTAWVRTDTGATL